MKGSVLILSLCIALSLMVQAMAKSPKGTEQGLVPARPAVHMASMTTEKTKPAFDDKRIEVNLASRLLALYQGDVRIRMYPVAPGRPDTPTPLGWRKVVSMEINPDWIDPETGIVVPTGPGNPLGYRWIGIGGNYGIHGTNRPGSIGKYASHGCMRMYENDVEDLFSHIVKGIPVDIIYERVIVEKAQDHTVLYYIYPDGYRRQPLTTKSVRKKLDAFGVSPFVTDEELARAIRYSSGEPHRTAQVYELAVGNKKLAARAYGKNGQIMIPVFPVAKAAGIPISWSPTWQEIRSSFGRVSGMSLKGRIYIDAEDLVKVLPLIGRLDGGTYQITEAQ
ncbi:MAG: L,D-transpeptidase [Dialister sp.]|nr:L,D-transpeptidase [Dialister sp.]